MNKTIIMLLLSLSILGAKIEVTGQGVVKAEPNIVKTNLGINTQRPTIGEAMEVNKTMINKLYEKLISLGIDKKDINTSQFYLNYYLDQDKKDVYTVTNNLEVKIRDLSKINDVLATSTEVGVNNIWGINFVSDNTENLATEARTAAIQDARKKAEELAKASGMKLGKVLEIVEIQSYNYGFETRTKTMAYAPNDMVFAPSELSYSESVKVIYELKK